jgi:hypothetical protein
MRLISSSTSPSGNSPAGGFSPLFRLPKFGEHLPQQIFESVLCVARDLRDLPRRFCSVPGRFGGSTQFFRGSPQALGSCAQVLIQLSLSRPERVPVPASTAFFAADTRLFSLFVTSLLRAPAVVRPTP